MSNLNCLSKPAAYFDIGIIDTKGLMILKNVFSSFMVSYPSVQILISTQGLLLTALVLAALVLAGLNYM